MKNETILVVTTQGDPDVGIFSSSYEIPCPFVKEDVEPRDLEYFRSKIIDVYGEFLETRVYAEYNFENQESDLLEHVESLIETHYGL